MRSLVLRLATSMVLLFGVQTAADAAVSFTVAARHDNRGHGYDNHRKDDRRYHQAQDKIAKLRFEAEQLRRQAQEAKRRADFHRREADRYAKMRDLRRADHEMQQAEKDMRTHYNLLRRANKLDLKVATLTHHHPHR